MVILGQTLVIALSGLFLFLKGKTGALAPFSYLVKKNSLIFEYTTKLVVFMPRIKKHDTQSQ